MTLEVLEDPDALADRAEELMQDAIARAIVERGRAHIALSGGSTPGATYRRYAAHAVSMDARWYFVDERCVPPDSDRSNYRAAREDIFTPAGVPDAFVFRMEGERDPHAAAKDYAALLCRELGVDPLHAIDATGRSAVELDLVIAGMGSDGHTASLFPMTGAVNRKDELVTVIEPGGGLEPRITLTVPVLLSARRVLILVSGEGKRTPLAKALAEGSEDEIPSRIYQKADAGVVTWLVDSAARG